MANLTAASLETIMLQDLQANVTTDPPVSTVASAGSFAAAETSADLNDAYSSMWEMWGGSITKAASATLWTVSPTAGTTGILLSSLTTISEILHLWSNTSSSTSVGGEVGDSELDRVDLSEVLFYRARYGASPPYTVPKIYAVSMQATSTAADVGKLRVDYWPGIASTYFPAWYVPHFTALAATTDVPDLPDLAQRDLAHLAAFNRAPLIGRSDLLPGIAAKFSEKTQLLLKRRIEAKLDARQ